MSAHYRGRKHDHNHSWQIRFWNCKLSGGQDDYDADKNPLFVMEFPKDKFYGHGSSGKPVGPAQADQLSQSMIKLFYLLEETPDDEGYLVLGQAMESLHELLHLEP